MNGKNYSGESRNCDTYLFEGLLKVDFALDLELGKVEVDLALEARLGEAGLVEGLEVLLDLGQAVDLIGNDDHHLQILVLNENK